MSIVVWNFAVIPQPHYKLLICRLRQFQQRAQWGGGEQCGERGEQGTLHNLGQVQRRILAWPSVQRRTLLLKMGWRRHHVQEVRELPQRLFQRHQLPWKPLLCHLGPFARGWRRVRKGFWDPDWGSCRNPEWRGWFQYQCRVRWQCGERGEQGTLHNLGQVQRRILAWPSVQRRTLLLKMGWWRWWRPCVQEVRELPQRLFQWHQLPWKPPLCHLGPFARGWRRVRKGFWDPDWGSCRNPEWRGWFQYHCRVRWQCGERERGEQGTLHNLGQVQWRILAWPSVQRRTLLLKMGWWRWWRPCVQEVRELPQRLFQWHQLPWKPPLCHLGPFARGWRRVRKGFWDPDWGSCRNPEWRGWFQYHCRVRWQCGERERGEQGTLHNLGQVQRRILAWPSVQRRTLLLKMGWWRWWRPCVQEVRELPQRLFQWHQLPWKPPLCHLGPFARGWRRVRKGFWDPDWGSCRNPEWRGWFQYHCRVRWQCGERERGEQGTLHNLGQVQWRILAWPSVQRRTLLLKMGWWRWWRPCVQEVRELPQRLFQWHQLPWKPSLCHLGPFARGWRRVRKGFWDPDWGSCRNPEWRGWFQYQCRVRWQCGERERGEQGTLHNLGQVQRRILAWPSVQRRTLLLKMGWWRWWWPQTLGWWWWRPCVQEVCQLPQRLFQRHQMQWQPPLCQLALRKSYHKTYETCANRCKDLEWQCFRAMSVIWGNIADYKLRFLGCFWFSLEFWAFSSGIIHKLMSDGNVPVSQWKRCTQLERRNVAMHHHRWPTTHVFFTFCLGFLQLLCHIHQAEKDLKLFSWNRLNHYEDWKDSCMKCSLYCQETTWAKTLGWFLFFKHCTAKSFVAILWYFMHFSEASVDKRDGKKQ